MANMCNLKTTVHCYSEQHAMEVKREIENSFETDNAGSKRMYFKQSESRGFELFSAEFEQDGDKVILQSQIKLTLESLEALWFIQYLTGIAGKVSIKIEFFETCNRFDVGQYLYDGTSMEAWWIPPKAFFYFPDDLPSYEELFQILEKCGRRELLFEDVDRALGDYSTLIDEEEHNKGIESLNEEAEISGDVDDGVEEDIPF